MGPIFPQKVEKFIPDGTDRVKDMVKARKLFQTEENTLVNGKME